MKQSLVLAFLQTVLQPFPELAILTVMCQSPEPALPLSMLQQSSEPVSPNPVLLRPSKPAFPLTMLQQSLKHVFHKSVLLQSSEHANKQDQKHLLPDQVQANKQTNKNLTYRKEELSIYMTIYTFIAPHPSGLSTRSGRQRLLFTFHIQEIPQSSHLFNIVSYRNPLSLFLYV